MGKIEGTLTYHKDIDRYVIHAADGSSYELHCGNYVECLLDGHWIGARIEMRQRKYYLTNAALSLEGIEQSKTTVKREWGY